MECEYMRSHLHSACLLHLVPKEPDTRCPPRNPPQSRHFATLNHSNRSMSRAAMDPAPVPAPTTYSTGPWPWPARPQRAKAPEPCSHADRRKYPAPVLDKLDKTPSPLSHSTGSAPSTRHRH